MTLLSMFSVSTTVNSADLTPKNVRRKANLFPSNFVRFVNSADGNCTENQLCNHLHTFIFSSFFPHFLPGLMLFKYPPMTNPLNSGSFVHRHHSPNPCHIRGIYVCFFWGGWRPLARFVGSPTKNGPKKNCPQKTSQDETSRNKKNMTKRLRRPPL